MSARVPSWAETAFVVLCVLVIFGLFATGVFFSLGFF